MLNFFAWYLLITLLGWLTFPLVYRLFPALTDRGYSLARVAGLLIWGYVFWLLASLGVIQNDGAGLAFALAILALFSAIGLRKAAQRQGVWTWVRTNGRLIITVEVLFFLSFAAWAFVRASNPNVETAGGEKTMELAFINAIMRSPTFPPHDPWLSDYAISYYYFGYVMAAMLAKATSTLGSVAHNLMTSLIFALSMVGSYGVLYNLLAAWRGRKEVNQAKPRPGFSFYSLPLLGPLFLLFVSNWEAFLYYLHKHGVFWSTGAGGEKTSAFWSWLGIQQLSEPSSLFNWWWRASRVIQDFDLAGNSTEIIDEFPAFSFLLGDLHPHVLAIPFSLLAVAAALNLFRGGWKGETDLFFYRLPVRPVGIFFGALILGGLAFLNTWDILTGFALMTGTFVLTRIIEDGWSWKRLEDLFAFGLPVGALAIVLYLPFYLGFSSQAGGLLPNLISPTRGAHLWVFFGTFFIALFPLLIYMWRGEKLRANWKAGFGIAAGVALLLWLLSWGLAFLAYKIQPAFVQGLLDSQCSGNIGVCLGLASMRRLLYIGGLLTLLGLLGPALAFIIAAGKREQVESQPVPATPKPFIFVMLILAVGTVLVLTPDFIFLRDLFTNRSNTIFKFYYQAWLLWSLAAAFGAAILLQLESKNVWGWVYRPILVIAIIVSLAFPVMGLPDKTNNFQLTGYRSRLQAGREAGDPQASQHAAEVWTLDGARLFHNQYPDDAAAADWLLHAPAGVVAEAVSRDAYSDFGRISAYSGQPTVLGWIFHEQQWRGGLTEQESHLQNLTCRANNSGFTNRMRSDDVACLYQTSSWDEAAEVINEYHIRYVVVGTLERQSYRVNETLFKTYLTQVFESGAVVIYEVRGEHFDPITNSGD
jgi:YYY domain-containing protein